MTKNILNVTYLCIAILSLIITELFCANLAFETLGEVMSALYLFIITINIVPLLLLIVNKRRQLALGIIFLIGFVVIPYQFYLAQKLVSLKEEAANLTTYLYDQKKSTSVYPKDISGYLFTFPELKKNFNYSRESENQFSLYYYVGSQTTSHFYHSDTKKWGYYPD